MAQNQQIDVVTHFHIVGICISHLQATILDMQEKNNKLTENIKILDDKINKLETWRNQSIDHLKDENQETNKTQPKDGNYLVICPQTTIAVAGVSRHTVKY